MPGMPREIENALNRVRDTDGVWDIETFDLDDPVERMRYKLVRNNPDHKHFKEVVKFTAQGTKVILKYKDMTASFDELEEAYHEAMALEQLEDIDEESIEDDA